MWSQTSAEAAGIALGAGYPGTPSTEILEEFSARGGRARAGGDGGLKSPLFYWRAGACLIE
jgi:hypothetical protein